MTDGGADYCFECVGNVDIMLAAFESCQEVTFLSFIVQKIDKPFKN